MTLNYIFWSIVKPSHWILLLAIIGVLAWQTRVGGICRNIAAILLVVFGLLPTGNLLMRPLETRFAIPELQQDVAGIIVLAGSEHGRLSELYGQPQLSAAGDRLTTFMILAEAFADAQLVFSGAFHHQAASAVLVGSGLADDRLLLESESVNTCDSARRTMTLLTPDSNETWLLVTSAFHMPRAMACYRSAGWTIQPYPSDYRTGSNPFSFTLTGNLGNLDRAAHEWLGLFYYRLRGWTNDLFPGPLSE